MTIEISNLQHNHIAQSAELWASGWHDAHSPIVPKELAALRTPESFVERLRSCVKTTRVGVSAGQVLGLCITQDDEIYQLYVAPKARGQGLAQALMADAEKLLLKAGYPTAWLACAIGNERAAKFYSKSGWENSGVQTVDLDTCEGAFPLQVWRFEKRLV